MNLFGFKKQPRSAAIFVLVRFWPEDGVWNASAMDIPVAVFGSSFEDARKNFEEAFEAHLEVLAETKRLKKTLQKLERAAQDRGAYDRIQPGEMFEKFPIADETWELCHQ